MITRLTQKLTGPTKHRTGTDESAAQSVPDDCAALPETPPPAWTPVRRAVRLTEDAAGFLRDSPRTRLGFGAWTFSTAILPSSPTETSSCSNAESHEHGAAPHLQSESAVFSAADHPLRENTTASTHGHR